MSSGRLFDKSLFDGENTMEYKIRPILEEEYSMLEDFLYEAIFLPHINFIHLMILKSN